MVFNYDIVDVITDADKDYEEKNSVDYNKRFCKDYNNDDVCQKMMKVED